MCAEQGVAELFLIARQYTITMYHELPTLVKKSISVMFLYSNKMGRLCVQAEQNRGTLEAIVAGLALMARPSSTKSFREP